MCAAASTKWHSSSGAAPGSFSKHGTDSVSLSEWDSFHRDDPAFSRAVANFSFHGGLRHAELNQVSMWLEDVAICTATSHALWAMLLRAFQSFCKRALHRCLELPHGRLAICANLKQQSDPKLPRHLPCFTHPLG